MHAEDRLHEWLKDGSSRVWNRLYPCGWRDLHERRLWKFRHRDVRHADGESSLIIVMYRARGRIGGWILLWTKSLQGQGSRKATTDSDTESKSSVSDDVQLQMGKSTISRPT